MNNFNSNLNIYCVCAKIYIYEDTKTSIEWMKFEALKKGPKEPQPM